MAKITRSPWMGCFTLADTNAHKISDILADTNYIAAGNQPLLGNLKGVQCLVIGNDIDNAGAKVYVGNENLTTTFYGKKLVASQDVPYSSMEANLISLDQLWVLTDTIGAVVTVNLLSR